MTGEYTRLFYAIVLAVAGLTLITARNRIAEFRNRHAVGQRDQWGIAEPRRYLVFGLLFLFLAVASLIWAH